MYYLARWNSTSGEFIIIVHSFKKGCGALFKESFKIPKDYKHNQYSPNEQVFVTEKDIIDEDENLDELRDRIYIHLL